MITILLLTLLYSVVVAASIIFLGKPSIILGELSVKTFFNLLLDWHFLLGGFLALVARFIFVVINNVASKIPELAGAHLTITALATTASVVVIIVANQLILGEQLKGIQILGAILIIGGTIITLK